MSPDWLGEKVLWEQEQQSVSGSTLSFPRGNCNNHYCDTLCQNIYVINTPYHCCWCPTSELVPDWMGEKCFKLQQWDNTSFPTRCNQKDGGTTRCNIIVGTTRCNIIVGRTRCNKKLVAQHVASVATNIILPPASQRCNMIWSYYHHYFGYFCQKCSPCTII